MKTKRLLLSLALYALALCADAQKYAGGDISCLPLYEEAGCAYIDSTGNTIDDLIPFCKANGWNAIRLRLFVEPDNYTQSDKDSNACQDLDFVKTLGKRVKDAGMSLLIDFHYSDTWADPAKQWTPKDWEDLSDDDLATQIYDYTKEALTELVDAGATPDLIQTGNEISYGMCWGAYGATGNRCYMSGNSSYSADAWTRFTNLLKAASEACREVTPDAKIILHTERVAQRSALTNFYDEMADAGVDYDIIGLSYYSAYHGYFANLKSALTGLADYDKDIMIVETGYPLYWGLSSTTYDYTDTYPYSDAGQKAFTDDLIELLNENEQVTGLFWWWPEYNPYVPGGTNLTGWYNAPLIEPYTGVPTSAFYSLKNFLGETDGINALKAESQEPASDAYYNLSGQRVNSPAKSGIYILDGKKIIVSK